MLSVDTATKGRLTTAHCASFMTPAFKSSTCSYSTACAGTLVSAPSDLLSPSCVLRVGPAVGSHSSTAVNLVVIELADTLNGLTALNWNRNPGVIEITYQLSLRLLVAVKKVRGSESFLSSKAATNTNFDDGVSEAHQPCRIMVVTRAPSSFTLSAWRNVKTARLVSGNTVSGKTRGTLCCEN